LQKYCLERRRRERQMETPASISQWATHAGNVELHASVASSPFPLWRHYLCCGDWDTCVLCRRQPEAIDATYDHSRARFHAGLRVGNDRVCAAIMPSTSSTRWMPRHSRWPLCRRCGPCTDRSRDDRQHSVRQRPRRLRDCGRDRTDVSLCHTEWRTDVAQVVVQKGARTLGLTTATNAIYAITGVCSSSDTTCGDYHIARSPLSANRWTGWKMPIGHSAKTGVWDSPMFRLPTAARYGSPSNLPARRHLLLRDSGRSFQKLITPNWAV